MTACPAASPAPRAAATSVRIASQVVADARLAARRNHCSLRAQVSHWVRLGMAAEGFAVPPPAAHKGS